MSYLFIAAAILLLIYVIRRPLDFFSVGSVCLVIYNYYCAIGHVNISSKLAKGDFLYEADLLPQVYFIVLVQMVILFCVMFYYDHTYKVTIRPLGDSQLYSEKDLLILFTLMGILSLGIMTSNILKIGIKNLSAEKSEVWVQTNTLYLTGLWLAMAVFAYAMKHKKFLLFLISVPQILIHLYIGSRAYFAVICILVLIYYSDTFRHNIKKNLSLYLVGAIMVFLIMVYKKLFMAVKAGDIDTIIAVLKNPDTYTWVLKWGEPKIVLANLNYIFEHHIQLSTGDIQIRLVGLIPFVNDYVNIEGTQLMSTVLRTQMNSTYGLASNMWGEFYAAAGYPCVFIMYCLWIKLIAWGNRQIRENTWQSFFVVPLIAYYAYYIHRMDFVKAFGNAKMVVFGMILFFGTACVLKKRRGMRLGKGVYLSVKKQGKIL